MTNIFEYDNYRSYLQGWIASQGKESYGIKGKIASALRISSSLLSQILKSEKSLTPDQTSDLCDFLALNDLESEYLHALVDFDRAANVKYRNKLQKKIQQLKKQSLKIGKRVPHDKELTEEQKAIYYSSWLYTGVRNLAALKNMNTALGMANHLGLEPQLVQKALHFLLENGFCKELENGGITYGPAMIHIDKESPFVNMHHRNWRQRALHQMESRRDEDIFYTSPLSLSEAAAEEIRSMIPHFIQSIIKISGPSESEKVVCMNIDWFGY